MSYHMGRIEPTPADIDALDNQLAKTQGSPLFGDVAPHLRGTGEGKLSAPFLSVLKFSPGAFGDDRQTTGDCTSHGTRNACDISRAVEIDIKKEPEEWVARGATEPIYAARGWSGGGMVVTTAAKFVNQNGFMVRKNYEGVVDLTTYNANKGIQYGGRRYPQSWLDAMKDNKMRHVARLTSIEQVRDAAANGYGVVWGCGSYQIDSQTDSKGIARLRRVSRGWNHCQSLGAYWSNPDGFSEDLVWIPNSWGKWNKINGGPDWCPQLPAGSCLVPVSDFVNVVMRGPEVYAIGQFDGFPAKDLPDYSSSEWM